MFYAERFNNNPVLVGNGIKVNEIEEIPRVSDRTDSLFSRFDYHGKGRIECFIYKSTQGCIALTGRRELKSHCKLRIECFLKSRFWKAKDKLIMGASAVLLLSRREECRWSV